MEVDTVCPARCYTTFFALSLSLNYNVYHASGGVSLGPLAAHGQRIEDFICRRVRFVFLLCASDFPPFHCESAEDKLFSKARVRSTCAVLAR